MVNDNNSGNKDSDNRMNFHDQICAYMKDETAFVACDPKKDSCASLTGIVYHDEEALNPDAYYFMLRKNDVEFAMSLDDIVQCLLFAEEQKLLPALPETWKNIVRNHFE